MQVVARRTDGSLRVENGELRARRGRILVSSFNWQHNPGGVAWLTGENGTGKSSLLRVLAGCERPFSGRVVWQYPPARVRYYTPSMFVPADVSVADWISLVTSLCAERDGIDALTQLRPATESRRRFRQLSTGEAKRFLLWGLLRSLQGPLILDEPYEHLSREAKAALTATLRSIALHSVVVVATNQEVPLAPAERLLSLDRTEVQVLR